MTLYINTVHMSAIAINTNATIFATSPGCSEQKIKSKKKYAASKKYVRCTYYRVAKMHRICRSLSAKEPLIIGLFYRKWPITTRHPMHSHHPVLTRERVSRTRVEKSRTKPEKSTERRRRINNTSREISRAPLLRVQRASERVSKTRVKKISCCQFHQKKNQNCFWHLCLRIFPIGGAWI